MLAAVSRAGSRVTGNAQEGLTSPTQKNPKGCGQTNKVINEAVILGDRAITNQSPAIHVS